MLFGGHCCSGNVDGLLICCSSSPVHLWPVHPPAPSAGSVGFWCPGCLGVGIPPPCVGVEGPGTQPLSEFCGGPVGGGLALARPILDRSQPVYIVHGKKVLQEDEWMYQIQEQGVSMGLLLDSWKHVLFPLFRNDPYPPSQQVVTPAGCHPPPSRQNTEQGVPSPVSQHPFPASSSHNF